MSFAWFCWIIWDMMRNDIIWREEQHRPEEVCYRLLNLKNEYMRILETKCLSHRRGSCSSENTVWMPPPQGSYVMNIDATLFKSEHCMDLSAVIRDSRGDFIADRAVRKMGLVDPFMAEAAALEFALLWLVDLRLSDIIIQTDCLNLTPAMKSQPHGYDTEVGHVLSNFQIMLQGYPGCQIVHVKRGANRAAHSLARSAVSLVGDTIWMESAPGCIADIL